MTEDKCKETERRPDENSSNATSLLEALEECRDYLYDVLRDAFNDAQVAEQSGNPNMAGYEREQKLHKAVEAAIAAPPRNCDVGTADEQLKRWESFCSRNWSTNYASRGLDPCDDCKLVEFGNCRCQLLWAQMPFAPAEGDEK